VAPKGAGRGGLGPGLGPKTGAGETGRPFPPPPPPDAPTSSSSR